MVNIPETSASSQQSGQGGGGDDCGDDGCDCGDFGMLFIYAMCEYYYFGLG